MKLWQFEDALRDVKEFQNPKIQYEQYITTPHLASHLIFTAQNTFDDIEGKNILDLGTGTGMLAIACAMMGASHVTGVDIDKDALKIAEENINEFDCSDVVSLLEMDVQQFEGYVEKQRKESNDGSWHFDTVVLNPPFGTRVKGSDITFLRLACTLTNNAVYSLHKSSTRDYVVKTSKKWGMDVKVIAELKYDLQKSYKFHKKQEKEIAVDLIRIEKKGKN